MKIPYIINKTTIDIYSPSSQTYSLVSENLRKILGEKFDWDTGHCPSLEECCIQSIAKNFQEKPLLNELPCQDHALLLDALPLDIPLEYIIPLIEDEYYWERRYKDEFHKTWRVKSQDCKWKNWYLERYCQKLLEEAQPQYADEETFDEILKLCNPYVKRLFIEQLQSWNPPLTMEKEDIPTVWPIDHINFNPIFKKLTGLEEISLVFGVNNTGESFRWEMFSLTKEDCQKLGKALQELRKLRKLKIHKSNLEFKHCQALIRCLIECKQLEELDLSHCKMSDTGTLCVCQYLEAAVNLKILNLTNNGIGKIGAEGLGYAIMQEGCKNLKELNLRLNPLGLDGTMGILRAIVRCSFPKKLIIAACLLDEQATLKISQMIKLNNTLHTLDVSSNYFGQDVGDFLVESIKDNTTIQWLDVRQTDISKEQQDQITEYLVRNRKAAAFKARHRQRPEAEDEIFSYLY